MCTECDKAHGLIEQGNKLTHARSPSVEVLANPRPPKWVALDEWSDLILAILPDTCHGKDMQELTKFLHVCNKNLWCDGARYASETNQVHFVAQSLVGSMGTAWEQNLESADPASMTWEKFKKFLANQVTIPSMRQVNTLAHYNQVRKMQDQTVATLIAQMDKFKALLLS